MGCTSRAVHGRIQKLLGNLLFMFTISFIGCSWTQGHNIPYTHTYPYILHEKLNKSKELLTDDIKQTYSLYKRITELDVDIPKFKEKVQVINAGRSGASWVNYPQTIKYIHKKYNPNVYVIQHTTPDRGMLLWCSDKKKYSVITRDHDVYDNYIQLWDNSQCYYHLTQGMAEAIINGTQPDLTDHMFNEIERKSGLLKGNIIERVKYWYDHERLHPLTFEKYQETVEYCDMYVRRIGAEVIHMFWLDNSFVTDVPTNQVIVQRQIKDFDKLVVDNGYHFDKKGNTKLANLLINQFFKKEKI